MENRFIVKVNSTNPEFTPEDDMRTGVECRGYLVLAFDSEGDLSVSDISHISILELAQAFANDSNVGCIIRQATAIAEGMIKARGIKEDHEKDEIKKRLFEGIVENMSDE